MEQDIVNNLKSRVKKLEEELLKVVSVHCNSVLCPCFKSQTQHHKWVEFLVGSVLTSRGFSPRTPVTPQKPSFPNSNNSHTWDKRVPGSSQVPFSFPFLEIAKKLNLPYCSNIVLPTL